MNMKLKNTVVACALALSSISGVNAQTSIGGGIYGMPRNPTFATVTATTKVISPIYARAGTLTGTIDFQDEAGNSRMRLNMVAGDLVTQAGVSAGYNGAGFVPALTATGVDLPVAGLVMWRASAGGAVDSGISRLNPGVLGIGTGAAGNAGGTLQAGAINIASSSIGLFTQNSVSNTALTNQLSFFGNVGAQFAFGNTGTVLAAMHQGHANPAGYYGVKTRSNTLGGHTVVQNNDAITGLFAFASGGNAWEYAGAAVFEVDGTPGVGDMPTRFIVKVSPDGSATPAEALRISQDKTATFAGTVKLTQATFADSGVLTTVSGGALEVSTGLRQTGTYVTRIENIFGGIPAGATGVGLEIGISSGASTLSSFNRTSVASSPMQVAGSLITLTATDGVVSQHNTTNPQAFQVYNTRTDASNYERGVLEWSGNTFYIGTVAAGSGAVRNINFFTGSTSRWIIAASSGNFLAADDNVADIGASGATRPRTGYFGTSVVTPQVTFSGGAEPTCNAGNAGAMVRVAGGAGVADTIRVCGKNAADAYVYADVATFP